MNLNEEEKKRYHRHIIMPEITAKGQQKLKQAKVLVVGAGGLSSPLLMYLAAAGIGHIGIIDDDVVDVSNLQRQILYQVSDIGKLKVECAKRQLLQMNPLIDIRIYPFRLNNKNVFEVFEDYDLVCDGTDNFPTRYLVNDACVMMNKINVFASIYRMQGQVAVFNAPYKETRSVHYRHIFPSPPQEYKSCAEAGVLGVLPGIVGSIQASEVIKIICGIGMPLINQMLFIDAADLSFQKMNIPYFDYPIEALAEDNHSCNIDDDVEEISNEELYQWYKSEEHFQLLDVREDWERKQVNIGGLHIPLKELEKRWNEVKKNTKTVVYCRSGCRSQTAIELLQSKNEYNQLYNLKGGVLKLDLNQLEQIKKLKQK